MIACRNWWTWMKPGYITMTRRQSNNECSGGIAAHPTPKNSECKNPLEKFASIFWDQDGILLIDYLPKGQTKLPMRSITHLCWCKWTFWRKNTMGRSPRESCSCMTIPRLTGHLQPRKNWPTWASNFLITHPILWIWSRRTTTCFLDWKNNWKVIIFRLTWRSLLPRRPGWADNLLTDNLLNFFWVVYKS